MENLKLLTRDLNKLIEDEDLTDEQLREASEGLLPNLATELNNYFRNSRQKVYEIIDGERDYQDSKWDIQTGLNKPTESYIVYMQAYLNQAIKDISFASGDQKALDSLRKVVSLGIACFEVNGVPPRTTTSPVQSTK